MTREEAIKIIDCYDIGFYDLSGEKIPADKLADAFDMAIEALQAEPTHGRLIDADGLMEYCSNQKTRTISNNDIARFPTVQADRPQGEWISNNDGSWNCSECGLRVLIYAKGNYCPNCGAKMVERG